MQGRVRRKESKISIEEAENTERKADERDGMNKQLECEARE